MKDHFLIIGGTTKAGTTSLFEYLSDHPEICKSSMKETRFFLDKSYPLASKYRSVDGINKYQEYFLSGKSGSVKMEATPDYLYCGHAASNIKASIPDAKLLFILRDPVSRLISWYNFSKQIGHLPNDVSLEEYVYRQESLSSPPCEQYLMALEQGRYSQYLEKYYKLFPKENIYIAYYENLSSDVRVFMKNICLFLEINPDFYDLYDFHKYNQTMAIKNQGFHKAYTQYSLALRKVTHNRKVIHATLKKIKKILHPVYLRFNSNKIEGIEVSDALKKKLVLYYKNDYQYFKDQTGSLWNKE